MAHEASPVAGCISQPQSTLEAILETAVDGIVVIDTSGTIQTANKAIGKIFGYTREQIRGCPVSILMPEPYRSRHQGFVDQYLKTKKGQIIGVGGREVPGRRQDGAIIPLEIAVSEVNSASPHLFAAILRDISERKQAQQELIEDNIALEEKQRALDQDLEAAANIQLSLLPKALPALDDLDLGWFFQPSAKIGGDIFNLTWLDQDHLGLYMLDVSGHGVPAALVAVSVAQAMQREGFLFDRTSPEPILTPPDEVLKKLDNEFPFERFETFFTISYLIIDLSSKHLEYSNAGHPSPFLIRNSGEILDLETEGTIIGLSGIMPYSTKSLKIESGDMVFIYTDGIYEQENQENKDFGIERIKNIVFENRVNNAQEIIIELMSNLYSFTSNKPFSDDVSCFCLKFK